MSTKALKIVRCIGSPHYEIRWGGGGETPADLDGRFTTVADAKRFIEVWQAGARDEPVEVKEPEDPVPEKRRGRPPNIQPIGG